MNPANRLKIKIFLKRWSLYDLQYITCDRLGITFWCDGAIPEWCKDKEHYIVSDKSEDCYEDQIYFTDSAVEEIFCYTIEEFKKL